MYVCPVWMCSAKTSVTLSHLPPPSLLLQILQQRSTGGHCLPGRLVFLRRLNIYVAGNVNNRAQHSGGRDGWREAWDGASACGKHTHGWYMLVRLAWLLRIGVIVFEFYDLRKGSSRGTRYTQPSSEKKQTEQTTTPFSPSRHSPTTTTSATVLAQLPPNPKREVERHTMLTTQMLFKYTNIVEAIFNPNSSRPNSRPTHTHTHCEEWSSYGASYTQPSAAKASPCSCALAKPKLWREILECMIMALQRNARLRLETHNSVWQAALFLIVDEQADSFHFLRTPITHTLTDWAVCYTIGIIYRLISMRKVHTPTQPYNLHMLKCEMHHAPSSSLSVPLLPTWMQRNMMQLICCAK